MLLRLATVLFLSLPTSEIVSGVMDEMRPMLRPQSLINDTTTGSAEDSERFGAALAELGVDYVDATLGGSSRQMREAEAILIWWRN